MGRSGLIPDSYEKSGENLYPQYDGLGRTGVIPEAFASQRIKFRFPYHQPGELVVEPNQSGIQFTEAVFLHNVDKPFEVWRVIVRLTALNEDKDILFPQPASRDLEKRVRLKIEDVSKNQKLTKSPGLVDTLITSEEGGDGTWEWEVPYTMVRSEGFTVAVDTLAFPPGVEFMRVEVSFQGYLDIIEMASNDR